MAHPARPAGVVVLGMHRSGTSAVAGFLAKSGFYAGEDSELLPAAEDNPKGFFEREDVNALNDELLAELGGAWDRPVPRAVVAGQAPAFRSRVDELLARLAGQAGDRLLVLKDPRISLVWPAWQSALEHGFALVLVDRSPLDTALSVRRRDHRPLYVALALWQLYSTELMDGLAGQPVLTVHYEDFVADPHRQGPELLAKLAVRVPALDQSTDAGRAQGFVSSDMRHHSTGPTAASGHDLLTTAQSGLAEWLARLPFDWTDLQPPPELRAQSSTALETAAEYYDAVADRYGMETAYDLERHKALHFEQATELKDQHIENLEAAIGGLRAQAERDTGRLAELEAERDELRAARDELELQLRTLHEDGRAAASNFVAAAKRSLSGRQHQA
ncbi:MAG TPA: hypothetical protein VME46_01545 [Acidimicrobiales bacterium]|nr:hypothetical protein [Acidimicrobiales bacterium]